MFVLNFSVLTFVIGRLELTAELVDSRSKDVCALLEAPLLLVPDPTRTLPTLLLLSLARQVVPVQGDGRLPLGPQLLHAQQVLDVVVEQLGEDGLGVVAVVDGPLAGVDSSHPSVLLFLVSFSPVLVLVAAGQLGVLGVGGHVLVRVGLAK